jgi:uncharacterized protein (TIGR03067 family)
MRSTVANAIIAALLLMRPAVSAHAKVTAVTFEPERPIVGHSMTAIATDDQKHKVVKWIWYGTLSDAGTHSPIVLKPTVPGRASLDLRCGGTYKVCLEVTYGGPMPPPTEIVSALITVERPDALKIMKGLDFAAPYDGRGIAIEIQSQVMCGKTDAGEGLLGMAQRRVHNWSWWNGKTDTDQPWQPKAPGNYASQMNGLIRSLIPLTIDPEHWAKVPPGKPIVTWDEEVRLVYGLGSARREGEQTHHGGGKYVTIECPLGTERLSIIKIDASHWAIRERAKSVADDKAELEKETRKFQGTWTFDSSVAGGEELPADDLKMVIITFEGDKHTVKKRDEVIQVGTQKLGPSKSLKTIDVTIVEGPHKGTVMLGIYEIDADTLRVCFDPEGKTRPTEFRSPPGSKSFVNIHKRVK